MIRHGFQQIHLLDTATNGEVQWVRVDFQMVNCGTSDMQKYVFQIQCHLSFSY